MAINLKKTLCNGILTLAIAAGAGLSIALAETPATQPTANTTDSAPATQPAKLTVSADAQTELDAITAAYGKLKSLDLVGSVGAKSVVDGQAHDDSSAFTSSFQSPVTFRHTVKDDIMAGCTGEKSFVFDPNKSVYVQDDAPKTKADFSKTPTQAANAIQVQNPSLFMALSENAATALTDMATAITKTADEKIGDKAFTVLTIKNKTNTATALIDPATHLLRQLRFDVLDEMKSRGATNMTAAVVTVDYTSVVPDAPVKAEQFAWAPPDGAKDIASMQDEDSEAAAKALVGKAAPDFALSDMNGKNITLASLKGQVVLLDFWAIYCPPCRKSLPDWQKYSEEKKADGLKFFAVNLGDEKSAVQDFMKDTNLNVPILLDTDGKAALAYNVKPIPETVLIGKDGLVKHVIISIEPKLIDSMYKATEDELAKK